MLNNTTTHAPHHVASQHGGTDALPVLDLTSLVRDEPRAPQAQCDFGVVAELNHLPG